MFLMEIKVRRKSGKEYRWWVVIKTYWDKEKVRHRTVVKNFVSDSPPFFQILN
jgi:hypothetical protein